MVYNCGVAGANVPNRTKPNGEFPSIVHSDQILNKTVLVIIISGNKIGTHGGVSCVA